MIKPSATTLDGCINSYRIQRATSCWSPAQLYHVAHMYCINHSRIYCPLVLVSHEYTKKSARLELPIGRKIAEGFKTSLYTVQIPTDFLNSRSLLASWSIGHDIGTKMQSGQVELDDESELKTVKALLLSKRCLIYLFRFFSLFTTYRGTHTRRSTSSRRYHANLRRRKCIVALLRGLCKPVLST